MYITCYNHATIFSLLILTIQYNRIIQYNTIEGITYNMTLFGVLHGVSCTSLNLFCWRN